jgi:tetratricopeptide (TPR) repeat protein
MDLLSKKENEEISYPSFDEAINSWQLIIYANYLLKSNPKCLGAYLILIKAYILRGEYKAAIEACRSALDLSPNNAGLHNKLAILLWKMSSDIQVALEHFKKAIELEPEKIKFIIDYVEALTLVKNSNEEALFFCQAALALDPNNVWTKNLYYMLQN